MKEKLYKPIKKDNEHLVKSRNNPDRVRGLTRDETNKNQNIIEWEEVETVSTREELEMKLKQADIERETARYNLERTEAELKNARSETIKTTLDSGLSVVNTLSENPEIVIGVAKFIKKCKNKVSAFKNRRKSKTNNSKLSVEKHQNENNIEYKECSVEEAREIIIKTLFSYIEFRRNLADVQRIKINGTDIEPIDQLLIDFEEILDKHPQLMDRNTECAVIEILRNNQYADENKRIADTLHIDIE